MKLTKILALILAGIMLITCFVSCDSKEDDKEEKHKENAAEKENSEEHVDVDIDGGVVVDDVEMTVGVRFSVVDSEIGGKDIILEKTHYTMVGPEKEMTALSAGIKILNEYEVVFTADENSLTQVKDYSNTEGSSYWALYVNGEKSTIENHSQVAIKDGDEIEFIFEHIEK